MTTNECTGRSQFTLAEAEETVNAFNSVTMTRRYEKQHCEVCNHWHVQEVKNENKN